MIGRRVVTVGVAVAAVTVGGVAGAVLGIPGLSGASSSPKLAATAQSSTGGSGDTGGPHIRGSFGRGFGAGRDVLDAAAKALHLSTQDLLQKLSDGKTTIADVAKSQNVDLQDVIDAMAAVAKSDISKIVNSPFPMRPRFPGKDFGGPGALGGSGGSGGSGSAGPAFGHMPMIGGFGFGFRGALSDSVDAIAKALGISSSDLRTDLRNGQSIADIAKSKKVDLNKVIETLVDDAKAKIDAAVKDGHLPQEIATKLEAGLKDMITNAVNNSSPKGFGGFGGFEFGGGRGGHRGGPMMPDAPMPTPEAGPSN